MDIEKTVNAIAFEKAAEQKWYLSMRPASPKQTLEIAFDDGHKYKYLGTGKVNIGDPVIIEYGGATSYKMGNVVAIEDGINIKRTHALRPLYTFTTSPEKTDIRKNINGIKDLEDEIEVRDAINSARGMDLVVKGFPIIDYLVSGVLNAISVVAFPQLAGDKSVESAKRFLSEERGVPGTVFGQKASDYYYASAVDASLLFYGEGEIVYKITGFYPGWKNCVKKCSIWDSVKSDINNKWSTKDNAYVLNMKYGSDELQRAFDKNEEFRKITSELVYRSALSIIIRGGFVNLLESALSVQMPITDYYDKLVKFAKEIGSSECYELLKNTDYKNKIFEIPSKQTDKSGAKDDEKASKDFKIKDGKLLKYSGNEEVVVIPDGVKVIGEQSIDGTNVKKVIMSDTVTKIENKPLCGSAKVEEIVFSKSVSSIAPYAFAGVKSLKCVDLSETKLKTIRKKCFMDCTSLETVKLPKNLKSIEEYALAGIGAKEIVFPATVEKIMSNAVFPVWSYKEMSVTDLYFEGTGSIEFTIPGREFPLRIHCKKDSALWWMFEAQNEYNMKTRSSFGENKNVPIELIDYK